MLNFLQKIFDNNEREVAKYQKKVEQINALEPDMKALSDDQLRAKTPEFQERVATAYAKSLRHEARLGTR